MCTVIELFDLEWDVLAVRSDGSEQPGPSEDGSCQCESPKPVTSSDGLPQEEP